MPPEQAHVLANESSPVHLAGLFQAAAAVFAMAPRITEAFRTGRGVGWHEHGHGLFEGTERSFRSGYRAHLISEWIPALDGVEAKLHAGIRVADVGCGYGASTILLAKAYPHSMFVGYDYHEASLEVARRRAAEAGVAARVRFEVASATDYPGTYDVVAFFDCLHDMGDPVAAAHHVRNSLAPDGTWMLFEPAANDRVEDNLNPIGRLYYAVSTMVCTPALLAKTDRWHLAPKPVQPAFVRSCKKPGSAGSVKLPALHSTSCWKLDRSRHRHTGALFCHRDRYECPPATASIRTGCDPLLTLVRNGDETRVVPAAWRWMTDAFRRIKS